jgi:hypothetical protein
MPTRSDRSAPNFSGNQPEELERYFTDLESLFDLHQVADNQDRKKAAIRYLDIRTESLWKTTEAWIDPNKTYDEFRTEIFKLYPGASGDRTYTIQDLDMVVGHYARIGIISSTDLGEYYRRFLLISRYLITRNRMSTHEQSRTFFRGLQPSLEARVRQRLQQKFVDHFPDDPYDLQAVYEAASYVLLGTTPTALAPTIHQSPQAPTQQGPTIAAGTNTTSPPDPTAVKLEALVAAAISSLGDKLGDKLGDMFQTVFQAQVGQQAGAKPRNTGAAATGVSAPSSSSACAFCGGAGHFIRECDVVAEYTKAGKCKRSADGKVVLPSGAGISRTLAGSCLRERVDEWHRINPGQMAAQMLFEVAAVRTAPAPLNDAAGQSYCGCPATPAEQCTEAARVYALNRRPRPRPEVVIDSQPPHRSGRAGQGEETRGADSEAAPQAHARDRPPHMAQDTTATQKIPTREARQEPTHPYAAVPDATNGSAPGPVRPAAREPAANRHEPAYGNAAKVYDPRIAKAVYERAMDTPITVTQRELLSLSPEVRTQLADVTIKKRVPREPILQATIEEIEDEDDDELTRKRKISEREARLAAHLPAAFVAAARTPPANATVIADPYEAYLRKNAGNGHSTESGIVVAAESNALRAILPIIDGQDRVEAILDPGCQIVAMSEEISNALALPYDPAIRLHMVSANGGIDQSLGLARNVPFLVGDITLYLQVHVLRAPAYDILLGRPFDVLTQSVVRNFADENQTVTILDPNTGRKATVPTIPRGSHRFADKRATIHKCPVQEDF